MEICQLEDVLVRVSNTIYKDLKSLLSHFQTEDREQRTREFKKFVLRSRKCIFQVLALSNWVRKNDTKNFFKALSSQSAQLARWAGLIAFHLDRFFYLNRDIFFMFHREHEVEVAFELESRQRFPFFSSRVLTSKTPLLDLEKATKTKLNPNWNDTQINASYMTLDGYRELPPERKRVFSMAIRGKMALYDKLPEPSISTDDGFLPPVQACIDEGLLKIRCSEFFTAYLSLDHAKSSASWIVVYFHMFRLNEPNCPITMIDHQERMTALESETIHAISIKSKSTCHSSLKLLISQMCQVVLKERIRIVTKKFVHFYKNSLFVNEMSMPKYFDTPQCVEMREYFWHNEISKQMSYMMRFVLAPFQENRGVDVSVELYSYDPNNMESTMNERLPGSDQVYRLICKSTQVDTVTFFLSFKTSTMDIMTKLCLPLIKLKSFLLEERIRQSQGIQGMSVEVHPYALIVVFPHDVVVNFIMDRASGKIILFSNGLGKFEEMCQGYVEKIDEDLNSVQREMILLPYLSVLIGESKSMERFLITSLSSWQNAPVKLQPFSAFESLLKKLDFVLCFMSFIDYPLASMSELRDLASILRKPAKNSIAYALQCWDVVDDKTMEMQHFRKAQRSWLEEQILIANPRIQFKKQKSSATVQFSTPSSKLKVLYLYLHQKDQPANGHDFVVDVSSIICSLSSNALGKKTVVPQHWCTNILSLQRSTNLSIESIQKYVDDVLPWARKQFDHNLLVPTSFPQLLVNQPINKARLGHTFVQDRFSVIVEESEGIWIDLNDEKFLRVHLYTSGTPQSLKWGINKKQSFCPPHVLKAFKDKGLESPVLFASMKLRLMTQVRSKVKQKDEIVPYYVIGLEEFSINMRDESTAVDSNTADHFTWATVSSISFKCIKEILHRTKLPLDFEWLSLYPVISTIRTSIILIWTTAQYAYKGHVDFDSELFLKPISISRNATKLSIVFGLCVFDNEDQAVEARKSLLLDASGYCLASFPNSAMLNEGEEDDDEDDKANVGNSKVVSIRFADQSNTASVDIPFEKIVFEVSFDTLSELYQGLSKA